MAIPKFKIKHIGINTNSEQEAKELAAILCSFLDLTLCNETNSHIFAGDLFEIMKNENIGTKGHIALQTEDVENAICYFAEKNIRIKEDTIRYDSNRKVIFAYLDCEFGGFAFHLTT